MNPAEHYTYQFYNWEYRGRGWLLAEETIQLEPPFIPFFRHGGRHRAIDDGRRPTLLTHLKELFTGQPKPIYHDPDSLDYEALEPFLQDEESELQALQIKLPKSRTGSIDKMKSLLAMLSYAYTPISFEIIGTETTIIIQFVCDVSYIDTIETYLKAFFPAYACIHTDLLLEDIIQLQSATMVVDFGLKYEFVRPIATNKNHAIDPLTAYISILEQLQRNEQAGFQILFQPVINQWTDSIKRAVTMRDGTSFFLDAPDAPQLAMQKSQNQLYAVTIRAFAQAESIESAERILANISASIMQATKGTANELIPLLTEDYDFVTRVEDIVSRESHRLGMLLNVDELLTLLHFPNDTIVSKKLYPQIRTTKEVPAIALHKQFHIGINTHNGSTEPVTINVEDRLKHMHIIGATGMGKSTLIAQLVLQDHQQGIGSILFDPHGDLVDDIIALISSERLQDVVLIDPSDIEYPVGLNILEAYSDREKEVLTSDLVAAFQKYSTSWGDQMSAVLRNTIVAILESTQGGSLHDLRRFLLEKDFRTTFLKTVTDPSIVYYWEKEFPLFRSNAVGPIVMRLDTFLRPKSIRNMVVQRKGIHFEQLLSENKIILLKLSQGLIGKENSFLLGSLILSKLHQIIFRRQQQSDRKPVFLYLDEFQNFITPSIKEMLSGVRKYSVGLVLAHQDLQQLQRDDSELANSVVNNANARIVFRVGESDAKKLQEGFSGFEALDLQNLGKGEAIVRIEQPQYDCSVDTIPLPSIAHEEKQAKVAMVLQATRDTYSTPKQEVEDMLFAAFGAGESSKPEKRVAVKSPKADSEKSEAPTSVPSEPLSTPPTPLVIKKSVPAKGKTEEGEEKDMSTHRYLQTLIKKMAESKGYTAGLEIQIGIANEKVDVVLSKGGKRIAIEICNTTDEQWEMHNIQKCLGEPFDQVISVSGDLKQLEKIKKKCLEGITDFNSENVLFLTPDALFQYLDDISIQQDPPTEQIMKGYRVNVTYDPQTHEEMERKRSLVAKVIAESMRKKKS